MECDEKIWSNTEGELKLCMDSKEWIFSNDSRDIIITPWRETKKGPITEVVFIYVKENQTKEVIFEILEKKFNKEWCYPQQPDETAEKVMELCRSLLKVDTKYNEYQMFSDLKKCGEEIFSQFSTIRGIHIYYGNGLFFGMVKNVFGKIKKIAAISHRCMEFPATRLDSIAD